MASEAIKIPVRLWPHPSQNKNATWDFMTGSPADMSVWGVKCPDNVISDVNLILSSPIPSDIHATPNAKLRLFLGTTFAGTLNYKLQLGFQSVVVGTTAIFFNPTYNSQTQASAGANIFTALTFTLSGTFTTDRLIAGVLRRDGSDAADQIAGDIFIAGAIFVADT